MCPPRDIHPLSIYMCISHKTCLCVYPYLNTICATSWWPLLTVVLSDLWHDLDPQFSCDLITKHDHAYLSSSLKINDYSWIMQSHCYIYNTRHDSFCFVSRPVCVRYIVISTVFVYPREKYENLVITTPTKLILWAADTPASLVSYWFARTPLSCRAPFSPALWLGHHPLHLPKSNMPCSYVL